MFAKAAKKSRKGAICAFEDVTLRAHEIAVKRAQRVVLRKTGPRGGYRVPPGARESDRPYQRTGTYRRSIKPIIKKTATGSDFVGKIGAGVNYGKKLEDQYRNLGISADLAIKEFPKFAKQCFKDAMRKTQ